MGYCVDQLETIFEIRHSNVEEAWNAIKVLFSDGLGTINDSSGMHYAYIDSRRVRNATSFVEAMELTGRGMEVDKDGNIVDIYLNRSNLGDDDIILSTIAPFVESGSYIVLEGEDGDRWKWKFKDGEMCEVIGRFVWDDEV